MYMRMWLRSSLLFFALFLTMIPSVRVLAQDRGDLRLSAEPTDENTLRFAWTSMTNRQYTLQQGRTIGAWEQVFRPVFGTGGGLAVTGDLRTVQGPYFRLRESSAFRWDTTGLSTVGNRWTYRSLLNELGNVQTNDYNAVIARRSTRNGLPAVDLEARLLNNALLRITYIERDTSYGIFEIGATNTVPAGEGMNNPSIPYLLNPFTPGETNAITGVNTLLGSFNFTLVTEMETRSVTVPAGTFAEVMRTHSVVSTLESNPPIVLETTRWWVQGVGMIGSQIRTFAGGILISTMTDELLSYELR